MTGFWEKNPYRVLLTDREIQSGPAHKGFARRYRRLPSAAQSVRVFPILSFPPSDCCMGEEVFYWDEQRIPLAECPRCQVD